MRLARRRTGAQVLQPAVGDSPEVDPAPTVDPPISVRSRARELTSQELLDLVAEGTATLGPGSYGWPTIVRHDPDARLTVGAYTSIAREALILLGGNHQLAAVSTSPVRFLHGIGPPPAEPRSGHVHIGSDVWIGRRAVVLPGAYIEDGAIIGAGTVVSGRVPPFAVWVGSPGRLARSRFSEEQRRKLLDLRWWDWPDHVVASHAHLIEGHDVAALLRHAPARS